MLVFAYLFFMGMQMVFTICIVNMNMCVSMGVLMRVNETIMSVFMSVRVLMLVCML